MNKIILRSLTDADLTLVEKWLEKEYVKKWYSHPEEWLQEMRLRDSTFSFINHKIAIVNDFPIGFCQYYDCFFAQEEWYSVTMPKTTFSIDYLIGEKDYLQKGLGRQIVNTLIDEIRSKEHAGLVVVKPEEDNLASVQTLLSAGFNFDKKQQFYYLTLR